MSKMTDAIAWFKRQFADEIAKAIEGTPFTVDLIIALAMQETYAIWGDLYRAQPVDQVLAFCTGDTIDSPRRKAFPKTKAQLTAVKNGNRMFVIARQALEDVGEHISLYHQVAQMNPNKFCHGFGIFQYDLQHFIDHPAFFLDRRWTSFEACVRLCVSELNAALKRTYGSKKKTLTDEEQVYVAIAYNAGKVDFAKQFKQGYRDGSGTYYGEGVWAYLDAARDGET